VKEKLYKILAEKGETLNFSVALYNNELDPEKSKLAKRVAKQFIEGFAKFCEDNELQLSAGITELPELGSSGFVAVTKNREPLMFLAVPHDVVDIIENKG
jgi:hypothetical protein